MYHDKKIKIAINGFGRIGRNLFRLLLQHPTIEIVAVNDIADTKTMSHLLKYDSIHGVLSDKVTYDNNHIIVGNHKFLFFHEKEIHKLPWSAYKVDIVIEATGKFKTLEEAQQHIVAGAQKVILSAPPEDDQIKTIVLGVNEHILDGTESVISNASCTTNNAAPMIKVIQELCEIDQAYITTVHSYTTDQSLHDQPHKDLRRARGAAQSIVPTTTGAAKALTKIFPQLEGKIGGCGIRVPVPDGSLTDITFNVKRKVSIEEINHAFRVASETSLKNILDYTEDPIVSVDIIGNKHSCLFDAQLTSVIDKMVKIVGWYDNEIGYSSRLIDLIIFISKK
ncbi:type I glyceraldehyde-3-phosphate dehydrogenase [Flavobacterium sp.]|uniref:type I glyceraldehyde-3-phosphate dehydrogenase n=1 Tax=Flavobacterium sp. TaxID=239 RepID=UPI0025B8A519|nr:type I glyceraldehyde-3-phosphate dehydrogenase [Flavobacterium sp.]